MKRKLSLFLLLCVPLLPLKLAGQDKLSETRNLLDKWTETRQIISRERSDWRVEQSILADTKILLSNELERLNNMLEDSETSATSSDTESARMVTERDELLTASTVIGSSIADLEARIKTIIKTFPDPLTNTIKPLIRRIPEDPINTKSSLAERTQNIVGILSQADKFNSNLTVTSEARDMPNGKVVEVRTLYWGLATAYYVDASGTFSGIGSPGKEGWEWSPVEGAGTAIQKLLDVYDGTTEIQFVEVPARIN